MELIINYRAVKLKKNIKVAVNIKEISLATAMYNIREKEDLLNEIERDLKETLGESMLVTTGWEDGDMKNIKTFKEYNENFKRL